MQVGAPRPPSGSCNTVTPRLKAGDYSVLTEGRDFFDHENIASPFASLFAYAHNGEGPGREPEEARRGIEELLQRHRAMMSMIPAALRLEMGTGFTWLADTLAAAEARRATDNGLPVSADGLAALAGVRPKTVANLLASKTLVQDADGLIPAAAALSWLATRKDFVPSWWQTWHADQLPKCGEVASALVVEIRGP